MFKKGWIADLKHDNHCTFNNQHQSGDLYDHLMSTSIFTLILDKNAHMTSGNHEESDYSLAYH